LLRTDTRSRSGVHNDSAASRKIAYSRAAARAAFKLVAS